MKSLFITGYGALEANLRICDVALPTLDEDEVLVRIAYASINPHDYKTVLGKYKKFEKLELPAPIGGDACGRVVKKGKLVTSFELGDEVFGVIHGSISEFGKAKAHLLVKKPITVSGQGAASLPIVGLTTLQAFEYAQLKKGDQVLIHAGSGGIGSFAIQYAKSKGAFVYTTTSTANVEWVKALGADVVIDYSKENYLTSVRDIDIVYDTLGEQYTLDAFKVIKRGGKVVSILPSEINKEVAQELNLPTFVQFILSLKVSRIEMLRKSKDAYYKFLFVKVDRADLLAEISQLIDAGKIKPVVDKVFGFKEAIAAFKYLSAGRSKGKVIIKID